MSWRHRIAVLALTVLTGLPVSGAVCAMMCDAPDTQARSHHASGTNCEETQGPASDAEIRGVSAHDCSTHDAAVRQVITTAAQRGDAVAVVSPLAVRIVHVAIETANAGPAAVRPAPPGTAPPTTTPLVLRA